MTETPSDPLLHYANRKSASSVRASIAFHRLGRRSFEILVQAYGCFSEGFVPGTRGFSRRPRRSSRLSPRRNSWAAMRAARDRFCAGFSIDKEGRFSESYTDFFDNPAWDEVRRRAQRKAIEMRSQGWSGAAMLPYSELEYGGFRDTVSALLKRFRLHQERKPEAAE